MIEIALDGFAHHRFEALPAQRRIAAFAEIGKVRHEQHAQCVRLVEQAADLHLDVDAEEVEPELLRADECRS